MNRVFALTLLVTAAAAELSSPDSTSQDRNQNKTLADGVATRMLGGREVLSPRQFPYQVALEVGGQFYCGGSIIHPQFILTAAHCFLDHYERFKSYDVRVMAGSDNYFTPSPTRVVVRAQTLYVPTAYSYSNVWYKGGDIAVLKLKESLNVHNNPFISKLEPPKDESYRGRKAVITGFGYNWVRVGRDPRSGRWERGPGGSNGQLRVSEAQVIANDVCGWGYGRDPLPNSLVCAKTAQSNSGTPSGICGGDSGGPLVVDRNVVIGVVSISPLECKETDRATVYTRVSYWRDFIEDAIADRRTNKMYVTQLR